MRGSGQRLPITLRFTRVLGTFSHTTCFPFSCALWACFSDRSVSGERSEPIGALMPHAALWVVQQCRCQRLSYMLQSFNAARGFVCGAAAKRGTSSHGQRVSMPHAALWVVQLRRKLGTSGNKVVSMPHAALWVVQHLVGLFRKGRVWFQCRTRLCGWCNFSDLMEKNSVCDVSMPHAALWVVQLAKLVFADESADVFQCRTRLCGWCNTEEFHHDDQAFGVSMPHAALCVVQLSLQAQAFYSQIRFNAARGFVCGAARYSRAKRLRR